MRDVTFSDSSRPEASALQIEAMLYQSRPMHGVDQTLRAISREWRAFLSAFIFVMLLGVLYVIVAPRQYSAEATVMAAPRQADLTRTDSVFNTTATPEPGIVRDPDIEGEMQIMISPASLRRIVQELNLDKPRPGEAADRASLSDLVQGFRAFVGIDEASEARQTSVLTLLHGLFARVGIEVGGAKPALADPERLTNLAVEDLNRKLAVAPIGRSTMLRIQYSAQDPKLAADVANAVATNYIDTRYRGRVEAVANASEWLRQHTAALRNELVEAEARLAAFRAKSVLSGRDAAQLQNEIRIVTENIVAAKAVQQKAASRLVVAEERVSREGPMALLNWETGPGADEYLAQVRAISDMRKEASKLTAVQGPFSSNATRLEAEARNLERQLTVEAQTKMANLKMSAEAATRDVSALEQSLQSSRADYNKLDAEAVQLSAFERAAAASRTVYESFVTRWRATEQAGFNEAKAWLVSPASVPPLPSKPSMPLILLGSLVAAVGAGFSNARYKEYRGSQTIRTSEDIERYLPGVRSLGLLPELSKRHRHARDVVAAAHDPSCLEFGEAVRSLYASLKAATEHDRPVAKGRVVLVSSALPVEAKSSTTGVIASVASAAGQRVIVVDCDMRSPTMHDALAVKPIPGLAGCIEMEMSPRDVIRQNSQTGVWVMPAGQTRQSPQGVLQSPRLAGIFAGLREEFDLVLIDTPPLLGLADTRIVARHADHIVLAVCWCRTTWRAIQSALRMLAETGASIAGVVVTRVDINRLAAFEVPEAEPYRARNRSYYRNYYLTGNKILTSPSPKIEGPRT